VRGTPTRHLRGHLRIEHGRHLAARLVAWLLRLPRASASADTRLIVTPRAGGEDWVRIFDRRRLTTWQERSGASELAERFGILEFRFRLEASAVGGLVYVQRDAALRLGPLRVRIPASWAPRVEARESPAGPGRVEILVRVALPVVGPLITYEGLMMTEDGCR
jgi:hypothetical protein